MNYANDLIEKINHLQPMPKIASQIMEMIQDEKSSFSQVAELISYEPMISAELIKACNSAYFGVSQKIESVKEAISLLGLDRIIEMVLINCSSKNLAKEQKGYGLNEGELWRQSVASALIAKDIAVRKKNHNQHRIFTAALLKDIGKIILDRFVEKAFSKVNELVINKKYSFREAEKKIFGIDHAELAGMIAKKWNFSDKLVFIMLNHHLPNKTACRDIETCIVYLADTVCMMMGIGVGSDGLAYRFHKQVLYMLEISEIQLQEIMMDFALNMNKLDSLFSGI